MAASLDTVNKPNSNTAASVMLTRGYQQEMLDESLHRNLVIALDTGSGKTHIAVLRMKLEAERNTKKISWFLAPTVALIEQQRDVIASAIPVPVGLVSGASEPDQWKNAGLWRNILDTHRIVVSTPQILLDALGHGYVKLGTDISLLVFDEAHHATSNHPYNDIMKRFYFDLAPRRVSDGPDAFCRPTILGLTASPIYGGDVAKSFGELERNLDCVIRSSRQNREELSKFVHRPRFKHIIYPLPLYTYENLPSRNLAALGAVVDAMKIEEDPYVISLRIQLAKASNSEQRTILDQRLSKTVNKRDTFTHRGLRDFARAASDICYDLGPWAADWYVFKVLEQARSAANPFNTIMSAWQEKEKGYLLRTISQVKLYPLSFDPQTILAGISPRVRVLVDCLKAEEASFRSQDEPYSCLVFVTRRDMVLALSEVLSRVPETGELFNIGCLLGSSNSSKRHSFLDITRSLLKDSAADTLSDFRNGEKNLIVSTAVAEEGIDIQACGSVVRFDPPPNMVGWAQSRGRARRKKSSFILMFEDTSGATAKVKKWEEMERQMMALYNDVSRDNLIPEEPEIDEDVEFYVKSTGALLTLRSATSHLNHFCAVLASRAHEGHVPVYVLDPPDFPDGWHAQTAAMQPVVGPWQATVFLPRLVPANLRVFTTPQVYTTKRSAKCHAAFFAYLELYKAGLLNDNLIPFSSVINPDNDGQVDLLLKEVEKRASTANVPIQMDPWMTTAESGKWWCSDLRIEGLPFLRMFTRNALPTFTEGEFPDLYVPGSKPRKVRIYPISLVVLAKEEEMAAQEYTRRIFSPLYGPRMDMEKLDFCYLFLPLFEGPDEPAWKERRAWTQERCARSENAPQESAQRAAAELLGRRFAYPLDLALVRAKEKLSKVLRFVGWHDGPISQEEQEDLLDRHADPSLRISYPLLIVQPLPRRVNFLAPLSSESEGVGNEEPFLLHPQCALVELISLIDMQYAMLLPSILRWMSHAITLVSLRSDLFGFSPLLSSIPLPLLKTATTAPVSQEPVNYQRLETLGDTVLKYIMGIQLFAQYPLWHEGYLSRRKDHAVSNNRLAKEALRTGLYQWIIRDRFVPRKWRPRYSSDILVQSASDAPPEANPQDANTEDVAGEDEAPGVGQLVVKKKKKTQELSTKVLADVVEALIGAAYEHGGFDLAVDLTEVFGLGLPLWQRIPQRVETILAGVALVDELPAQLSYVERMLGYQFTRKMLLVEALTHASYQGDLDCVSYERLEFLGDSVLDMIVTDFLYHAPGKNYTPGHMHLRKEALVNSHFLAYICVSTSLLIDSTMPQWDSVNGVSLTTEDQRIGLWQCLLHSSSRVLDDQQLTASRCQKSGARIAAALERDSIYPWAALTSLQAPKFISDMVESLLGAVFLDSNGNLDAVRQVIGTLGITRIMSRIVEDDVDVLHPVSRLAIWAAKQDPRKKMKIETEKIEAQGSISCAVFLDDEEITRETAKFRGKQSLNEVRFAAAEGAIRKLYVIEQEEPEDVDEVDWAEDIPEYDW